ncbi:MAG: GNAT family N-acetyltransferase, partial [Thermoplasmataceae archaeon]
MGKSLVLRKPGECDIDAMFRIMEYSLAPFLHINDTASENNRLIIDRKSVEDYVHDMKYYAIIAEIESEIVGWMAGSSDPSILAEHGCNPDNGEFYLEEIVVNASFRGQGIGRRLIEEIKKQLNKDIVVDTPSMNINAFKFYEKMDFVKCETMPGEFSRNWIRMRRGV